MLIRFWHDFWSGSGPICGSIIGPLLDRFWRHFLGHQNPIFSGCENLKKSLGRKRIHLGPIFFRFFQLVKIWAFFFRHFLSYFLSHFGGHFRGVSGRSFWVFGMGLVWCRWEMVGCGVGGRGRGSLWWGIVREGGCM